MSQNWVLFSTHNTGKVRAKPANQREEKAVLAMRTKSRKGTSASDLCERCVLPFPWGKKKTWKLKANAYFQEKWYMIKWYVLITSGGYFIIQEITVKGHCALIKLYLCQITSSHPIACALLLLWLHVSSSGHTHREVLECQPMCWTELCSAHTGWNMLLLTGTRAQPHHSPSKKCLAPLISKAVF